MKNTYELPAIDETTAKLWEQANAELRSVQYCAEEKDAVLMHRYISLLTETIRRINQHNEANELNGTVKP